MQKFIVDKRLFGQYENLKIGVVICKNINNHLIQEDIVKKMDEVQNNIKEKFQNIELAEYPIIRKWRNIYKEFGEKKCRSSVEALIRRTVNGNKIPSINPLVDIYNLISLKYEFPCGGEDLDTITSDMELTYANGTEEFLSLGVSKIENPNVGEVVYKFSNTIICRNFNYRESDITKLTENTKNAILVMESVGEDSNLENALEDLAHLIQTHLSGTTKIAILNEQINEVIF